MVRDEGVGYCYWFINFSRHKKIDHMSISVVKTKVFFINKSWIKSCGTATVTQAVTCEPVTTQRTESIFSVPPIGLITFCGNSTPFCPDLKNTQNHTLKSILVVHSGNLAHSGKRMHRAPGTPANHSLYKL